MSYGQKKEVLISFGLSCNTSLQLMDEAANGLDIMSKSQFRKVIAGAIDQNKCIIASTNQAKDMESRIDLITVIDQGTILFYQTVDVISSKRSFKISFDSDEIKNTLYRRESLKGSAGITKNTEDREGKPGLEMLYKTIVTNGDTVRFVFK